MNRWVAVDKRKEFWVCGGHPRRNAEEFISIPAQECYDRGLITGKGRDPDMKFIQIGVAGFGNTWMRLLHEHPEVEVVALVDISDQALSAACETYAYPRTIGFHTLPRALAATNADALVCCTPPHLHCDSVVTALEAGLHVISEKPMASRPEDCRTMLNAARAHEKYYVISQNYRYRPATWTMAKWIHDGRLGRIGQVNIDFFKGVDFGGGFRHTMEYPLIVDMSIHHFDLIRFITGLDTVNVTARSWNPFWSNYRGDCSSTVLFEMQQDVRALYNASWCAKGDFCDWIGNWRIECEHGTLLYERDGIEIVWIEGLYAPGKRETVALEAPPLSNQAYVLNEFMAAIRGGPRPITVAEDNIKSLSMVFATVEAMQTGQTVSVSA